ncbi:hypothetical protein OEZ86_005552 [Tetradesmus obliquus]|nr:hypothetical protein OEZ86_005552 [Tetradesmus obliquus]
MGGAGSPLVKGRHIRSYHCPANKEYPSSTVAGRGVFRFLAALPSQLSPDGLAALVSVQLDAFPEAPAQWAVLQRLPCLRELLLPSFRPALPHEHLPALARLTQLDTLTVSVQGSITSWRANCASFASLGALSHLARLSLHAFHCPGAHLAAALLRLSGLEELRLSGRVVLEPLAALSRLGRLQVLELTQDVQYDVLCGLVQQLTGLTHLAVGRVTLPPAAPPPPPAAAAGPAAGEEAGQEQQDPAAAAADGAGDMPQLIVADAAPAANAAAGAVMVAADGGGAAAAAAGGGGGLGEVMLEDVGAIVDGLIGNLQEGAVPVHLQRIIERFESIIQLDLTRRQHSTPWGWPVPGLALLQELGSTSGSTAGSTAGGTGGTSSSSSELTRLCAGAASCGGGGAASLELALLRSADVVRLHELPSQLRCCSHLALRLRDQLLAFASVCPLRLAPGQLAGLAAAFQNLSSLSLCGKVALDGRALIELTEGLAGLQKMEEALQHLQGLKVLCVRHRGGGKLPLPLSALPASLTTLALKKAAHGEVAEAWPEWVAAVGQLTGLQVLDVAVPESTDCSLPPDLLQALLALPRLAHLHITTHHAPQQLLGLTALAGRLRTLNINYTGPPTLPSQLLSQLREGLGLNCRVQVWENVVLPSSGSFVEVSGGGGGGAEGLGGGGRRRRGVGVWRGVVRAASLGAVVAGGWWCGWVLGSALGGRQRPQRQQRQRKGTAGCS